MTLELRSGQLQLKQHWILQPEILCNDLCHG